MPQTIALNPDIARINLPKSVQEYEEGELGLESMRMKNEGMGIDLYERKDKADAKNRYRIRARKGDPDADEELAGYPDMQKEAVTMFDGMDAKTYRESRKRVTAFGEAAKYVASFPEGPQKQKAWEEKIDELAAAGYIEADQAEEYKAGGPNDLMLHNAMQVDDWMKQHFKTMDADRKREIEQYKADKRAEVDIAKAEAGVKKEEIKAGEDDETDAAKVADTESKIKDRERRGRLAEAKAVRDAANVKSMIAARDAKAGKDGGKTDRDDAKVRIDVEKLIIEHRKALGLDDPKFKEDYPDDHAEAVATQKAYEAKILGEFGFGPNGKRKAGAAPAKPGAKAAGGPPPLAERVVGQVYESPNGPLEWTGKGWKPAKAQ